MKYLFLFLIVQSLTIPVFSQEMPASINGKWQVAEVHINTASPRTPLYAWNDPRLVGRLFTFTPRKIENDTPDDSECVMPFVKVTSMPIQELVSKSMGGYGYPSTAATAKDYRLDVIKNGKAALMRVYCNGNLWNEDLGLDDGVRGSWLFLVDANRILLRWRDESILVLNRLEDNQKPNPSFNCSKLTTKSESEICGSIELSAFDRSVSQAYKLALAQYNVAGDNTRSLALEQKAWLAARNRCGIDKNCLVSSMKKRLDELSTPLQ